MLVLWCLPLEAFLSGNQVVPALVASVGGHVRPDGWSRHLVHVLEGYHRQGLVKFYNPLFNQDQELGIAEFNAAWEQTDEAGITNVDQIFIAAYP